jgi:hypothetical protein
LREKQQVTLSFFRALVSVRDLSTSRSTNSWIYVLQNSPPEHIPGFKVPRDTHAGSGRGDPATLCWVSFARSMNLIAA